MNSKKLTIAHISDLHRTCDNPISNVALLNSLMNDMDTYATQGIDKPDILIVSGDIVQGSADINLLAKQYDEALDFLDKLAGELFNSDKSRIILIPGNHDISWSESKKSMKKIEEQVDDKGNVNQDLLKQMREKSSYVRWSWADRSFYRILEDNENKEIYNARLTYFCDFYQKYYSGTRTYSLNPDEQFDLFDFKELGITIIGFNSCYHNDHLNRVGSINPECIAKVGLELRALKKQGRLIFATWHHSTKGGPYDQDYMDDTFIKNLISYNVKIGFHGHQHKHEVIRAENNIIDGKMMLILSAGSLCAGPKEIPSGYNQQYNLLELSRIDNDEIQLKLFSRVKTPESSFDNPIWAKGSFNSTATEFNTKIYHRKPIIPDLGLAEKLVGEKDYQSALDILLQHNLNDVLVRLFLLECYTQLENYSAVIKDFSNPQNNVECIALLNACIETNNKNESERALKIEIISSSTDPSVIYLRHQLKGKIK